MLNTQTVCNDCGTLLYGKHGTELVTKEYIYIKGRICSQNIDNKPKNYSFITHHDDEEVTVCNTTCLVNYLKLRQQQHKKLREDQLRQRAGREWHARG